MKDFVMKTPMPTTSNTRKGQATKRLYEVLIVACKVFYVEAESEKAILSSDIVEDEQHPNHRGDFEWYHDETQVTKLGDGDAEWIRSRFQNDIRQITPVPEGEKSSSAVD